MLLSQEFIQPSIDVLSLRIDEPVTTATDLLAAAVCFYAFFQISKIKSNLKFRHYIRYYFLSMGAALSLGGVIGHAFLYLFTFEWKLAGWITSMLSIALVERASIENARLHIRPNIGVFFAWLNIIELLTFIALTLYSLNFFFVEVHSTYGLLVVVTTFNWFTYKKTKNKGNMLFIIAVGFSAIAAIIFMNKLGVSKWFNHSDLSHCFLALCAWLFYKGSKVIISKNQLAQ